MLPRSQTERLVHHACSHDVTEGFAADWAVEQLRDPAEQGADRIDDLGRVSVRCGLLERIPNRIYGSDKKQPHQNGDVQRRDQAEHPLDRAQLGPQCAEFRAKRGDAVLDCKVALTRPNDHCDRLRLGLFEAGSLKLLRGA